MTEVAATHDAGKARPVPGGSVNNMAIQTGPWPPDTAGRDAVTDRDLNVHATHRSVRLRAFGAA